MSVVVNDLGFLVGSVLLEAAGKAVSGGMSKSSCLPGCQDGSHSTSATAGSEGSVGFLPLAQVPCS